MSAVPEKSRFSSIMDSIIEFLQFDLRKLYGATSSNLKQEEDTIEQRYGCRPKIYNGVEEVLEMEEITDRVNMDARSEVPKCSTQLKENVCGLAIEKEDYEDFSSSNDDEDLNITVIARNQNLDQNYCKSKAPNSRNATKTSSVYQQLYQKVQHIFSSASLQELTNIEERAQQLWGYVNEGVRSNTKSSSTWWDLKAWQKLPFYWAAISNEILSEEPFENFKHFYVSHMANDKRNAKKTNEKVLIVWHNLAMEQKMPFVMEAFIAKIGTGKVNMCDEHEIRNTIKNLQSKCD